MIDGNIFWNEATSEFENRNYEGMVGKNSEAFQKSHGFLPFVERRGLFSLRRLEKKEPYLIVTRILMIFMAILPLKFLVVIKNLE